MQPMDSGTPASTPHPTPLTDPQRLLHYAYARHLPTLFHVLTRPPRPYIELDIHAPRQPREVTG